MSWLKRLRRDAKEGNAPAAPEAPPPVCPHAVLVPRWESVADMGKEDLASGFRCDACGREFSPGEAQILRATEAERVRQVLS